MTSDRGVEVTYLPPGDGALLQGEILADVWMHTPDVEATKLDEGSTIEVVSTGPALIIVLNNECDLLYDYQARFTEGHDANNVPIQFQHKTLPFITACQQYTEEEIRKAEGSPIRHSDLWKRVKRNQDERYHRLPSPLAEKNEAETSLLYMDFKKVLALPTISVYRGIDRVDGIQRIAVLPPPFVYDLAHRFYGYLSRIAVPE